MNLIEIKLCVTCADLMVEGKLFAMDSELSEEYCVGSPVNIHLTLTSNAGQQLTASLPFPSVAHTHTHTPSLTFILWFTHLH